MTQILKLAPEQIPLSSAKQLGAVGILSDFDLQELKAGTLRVYKLMIDGSWHSAKEICRVAGNAPSGSNVSKRLSASEGLRRMRELYPFYVMERRRISGDRSFEYRITARREKPSPGNFCRVACGEFKSEELRPLLEEFGLAGFGFWVAIKAAIAKQRGRLSLGSAEKRSKLIEALTAGKASFKLEDFFEAAFRAQLLDRKKYLSNAVLSLGKAGRRAGVPRRDRKNSTGTINSLSTGESD